MEYASQEASSHPTALVLPGGGVRGAYEVGVVLGMVEVLGLRGGDRAPFDIFTGSSVGAINAGFLASHVGRGDLGIHRLCQLWSSLEIDLYLRWRLPRGWLRGRLDQIGWSLLDPRPLTNLVERSIDWRGLREASATGALKALIVTALNMATGQTTMFAEVGRGHYFRPSRDPHRDAVETFIAPEHILASAAFPGFFPAQRIGQDFFIDGGLRFNTPIAPAVRCGARRLVIVPTLYQRERPRKVLEGYPRVTFFIGKLINALIADRLDYDLHVMERINRLVGALEQVVTEDERHRIDEVLIEARGTTYQELDTLIIRPSEDIGAMAGEHIRTRVDGKTGLVFRQLLRHSGSTEADWGSYVLYDGLFAERLIDLGRRDSRARADEIKRFFGA